MDTGELAHLREFSRYQWIDAIPKPVVAVPANIPFEIDIPNLNLFLRKTDCSERNLEFQRPAIGHALCFGIPYGIPGFVFSIRINAGIVLFSVGRADELKAVDSIGITAKRNTCVIGIAGLIASAQFVQDAIRAGIEAHKADINRVIMVDESNFSLL